MVNLPHLLFKQCRLEQSWLTEHELSSEQLLHEPPQSISVSLPFLMLSLHVGAVQILPTHFALAQSEPFVHVLPVAQLEHPPPQSTSVSFPFMILSVHEGGAAKLILVAVLKFVRDTYNMCNHCRNTRRCTHKRKLFLTKGCK